MIKNNNRGFAITTVLYGLSIMGILLVALLMATMSSTRRNSTDIVKSIERDLNGISKAESVFSALEASVNVPKEQEFVVGRGQSGFYKIELWGAQGGGTNGGYGSYTSGVVYLGEGDRLYFYVGKHQNSARSGNATMVRFKRGVYHNLESFKSSIMVAAGGGASGPGGTITSFNNSMIPKGGYIDINGDNPTYGLNNQNLSLSGYVDYSEANIIRQNPGSISGSGNTATFGTNNGGDGYYSSNRADNGGVSYILGYAGSKTYQNIDPFSHYFVDGQMYPGVHSGDGRAKVTKVSESSNKDTMKANVILKNNYQYVRDCISNSGVTQTTITVMSNGTELTSTQTPSGGCVTYNLGSVKNIDEIAIWHNNMNGKDISNHKVSVSTNNSTWHYLKNYTGLSETETVTGIHISAYQNATYNTSGGVVPLVNGDYYIIPVVAPNKAISAASSSSEASNPLTISYLDGANRQKWKFEKYVSQPNCPANGNCYKIIELARYKAMTVGIISNTPNDVVSSTDENIEKNYLKAYSTFQKNDAQIWKVTPQLDGTYIITTIVKPFITGSNTGNILGVSNGGAQYQNQVILAKNNNLTQRFKLIALNYGSN